MHFKLANVLTQQDPFAADYPGIYWHAEEGTAHYVDEKNALSVHGSVDFTTYVNGLSFAKWHQYAGLDRAYLHLELSGDACEVYATRLSASTGKIELGAEPLVSVGASESVQTVEVPLPAGDKPAEVLGFSLKSEGHVLLAKGHYFAKVNEADVRPVKLALCTTTFLKEQYITRNIEAVKREVFGSDDLIAKSFHMFVVDNGKTLDAEALSDDNVTVIPNANVGGAGGFARGMLAGLDYDATHVLLMDDDVRVLPESFKRTFNLLSLAKGRYADAFINGAMLNLEQPNVQFEDVARVRRDGMYTGIKGPMSIDEPASVARNESLSVEVPNAYGAWWYACIPTKAIRKNGLPLPVFVRCDDVEYGIRCRPTYMTMNGICVWHERFEGRFRASVDSYQLTRNFLIMVAVDGLDLNRVFMLRFGRTFHIFLRAMAYETCELMLDGLADFLKGPDFIATANGEEIIKSNGAKNEKLVPVEQLDQAIISKAKPDMRFLGEQKGRGPVLKVMEFVPHDRHMLPDSMLSDDPAPVYYCRGAYPARVAARRKTLVAYDAEGKCAHIRHMDRERWAELNARYERLTSAYWERKDELAKEYQAAKPTLTSEAFWRKYLNMD